MESVRCARRFLDGALRQAGVAGDLAWDAALVAHELVTNAVQHARTDFQLRVAVWGDAVHLEVRDDNPRPPAPTRPPRWASSRPRPELA
ncbi:MAG TPA: ATP-binding protein, partial [Acidimicrobiales bacterium]|nr:ATP-binding protein [Acidimicrobiales bacterium]